MKNDIITQTKESTTARLESDKQVRQMVHKAVRRTIGATLVLLAVIGLSAWGGWVLNDTMSAHYSAKAQASAVATTQPSKE